MLADIRLIRLIRFLERQSERELEASTPKKNKPSPLKTSMTTPVINYLLEPYKYGFWELRETWSPSSPFAKYIISKLDLLSDIEDEQDQSVFSPVTISKKISEENRADLLRAANRLSTINSIFMAAALKAKFDKPPNYNDDNAWFSKLDLDELVQAFPEAWKIFYEQIYFDGFRVGINDSKPYILKDGFVTLLDAPRTSGNIHLISMSREELIVINNFYSALGAIQPSSVRRVFSPDEELFRPYFPLVSCVLTSIVHDGQISQVFEQSLTYYEDNDFQHCISTLGLIAEDYLQRIYTTMLREALPSGLTLGQIVDRIHKRVDELLAKPKAAHKPVDQLYEKIKILDFPSDSDALKSILRDFITILLDDRQHFSKRLDEISKPSSRKSVFPPSVNERINELLKWRNAASHNSRIPLGAHEADRTLFCLIVVITWWQEQLKNLDWSLERLPLIERLLQEASIRYIQPS